MGHSTKNRVLRFITDRIAYLRAKIHAREAERRPVAFERAELAFLTALEAAWDEVGPTVLAKMNEAWNDHHPFQQPRNCGKGATSERAAATDADTGFRI